MDEKKKGIIFGTLALVAGIAMIAYGVVNLMKDKEPVEDDQTNLDGPSITVTENDVETWASENKSLIDYFMIYNDKFDLDTATEEDISNVFAWYFVHVYDHGDGEKPTDSKYRYRYKMLKTDAEVFMQNYLSIPLDMVNIDAITLDKDNLVFSSDEENFYVDVVDLGLDDEGMTYLLDNVEILSDSEINLTYQIRNGAFCEPEDEECETTPKLLTLRKADDGFTILRTSNVDNTSTETDNNNLKDNVEQDNNQTKNEDTNQETENSSEE